MKGNALIQDQETWSDDLGYLFTISNLISNAHAASSDSDQDVYDWFWILEQLQIEVEGQLYYKKRFDQIASLDAVRLSVKNNLKTIYSKYGDRVGHLSQTNVDKLRDVVFPYHRALNRVIHEEQLRLRNHDEATKRLAVESKF